MLLKKEYFRVKNCKHDSKLMARTIFVKTRQLLTSRASLTAGAPPNHVASTSRELTATTRTTATTLILTTLTTYCVLLVHIIILSLQFRNY